MVRVKAGALAACAALVLGLPGCGGNGTGAVRQAVGRSVPPEQSIPGFSVTVSTDKSTYRAGEPIRITVSATNATASARTLSYTTGAQLVRWGYLIARDGRIVTYEYWPGHGFAFPTDVGVDTYAPGQTKTFEYDFPLTTAATDPDTIRSLAPGDYDVYAKLPVFCWNGAAPSQFADPTPGSAPVRITVTP